MNASLVAAMLAVAALGQLGQSSAAMASPAVAPAASAAAVPSAPIDRKVEAAKKQLAAASLALSRANTSLDAAAGKLPAAQASVARARAAVATAERNEAAATARLTAARARVVEQNRRIALVQQRIDALTAKIGNLARQAYVSGGEQETLALLLQTKDLSTFTLELESQRRSARANDNLFDQAQAARAELANQLQLLQQAKEEADREQADAAAQTSAKQAASATAVAAVRSVQDLVDQRAASASTAAANRSAIRSAYNRLLDQQARAHGGGTAGASGTSRSAKQAVAWAMDRVGGGAEYAGLCLGFVDDAYGATGSRQPRAIDQWYAAKRAGKGHPGDRTPPIGAQVFWLSGNPARHIAIYAGGGMVISTSVDSGRVGIVPMSHLDGWGPYIGWAEAYYP